MKEHEETYFSRSTPPADDAVVFEDLPPHISEDDTESIKAALLQTGEFRFHAEIKSAKEVEGQRIIEGYANTKNLDRMNEIVDPSAFKGTINKWMKNPVILADHWASVSNVIGRGLSMKIDETGPFLKAEIAKGTQLAEDTWTLIQQKMLRAFSIGYRILKDEMDKGVEDGGRRVRRITKLELYEVSVVAIPANRESLFSLAKGIMFGTDIFQPLTKDAVLIDLPTDNKKGTILEAASQVRNEMEQGLLLRELQDWKTDLMR